METYFVTIEELQEILHIGKTQAYALCHKKYFPFIRSGKRILINRQRLYEWITEQEEKESTKK